MIKYTYSKIVDFCYMLTWSLSIIIHSILSFTLLHKTNIIKE